MKYSIKAGFRAMLTESRFDVK